MYQITWRKIQSEKRKRQRLEKIKDVLELIAIVVGLLIAMAIGGLTFPY